jgi:hypothetical protein
MQIPGQGSAAIKSQQQKEDTALCDGSTLRGASPGLQRGHSRPGDSGTTPRASDGRQDDLARAVREILDMHGFEERDPPAERHLAGH